MPKKIGSKVTAARRAWLKNPKISKFHSQSEWDAMTPAGRQAAVKKIAGLKGAKAKLSVGLKRKKLTPRGAPGSQLPKKKRKNPKKKPSRTPLKY